MGAEQKYFKQNKLNGSLLYLVSIMEHSIKTHLSMTPRTGKNVFIDQSACVIGDVVLGDDCSVWPMAVIRGDMNSITIGDRTSIQDGAVLHITHKRTENPKGHPPCHWQ